MKKSCSFPDPSVLLSIATALLPMGKQLCSYAATVPDGGPFGIRNDVKAAQADIEDAYARLSYLLISQSHMTTVKHDGAFELRASEVDEIDEG